MRTPTPPSDSTCACRQIPRLTLVPGGDETPRRVRVETREPELCARCAAQGSSDPGSAGELAGPSAGQVLLWADQLLDAHGPGIAGRWARTVAMLSRQALETILAERCAAALPAARSAAMGHPAGSSMAPTVGQVAIDELLIARIDHTWRTLSRACGQPDETAPSVEQLHRWLDSVRAIGIALGAAAGPRALDPPRRGSSSPT
jgi:hypothetical protein